MAINPSLLDDIASDTQKKYKIKFRKGSEVPSVQRIPFLSPELNVATGGGIPLGRISRLWGEESSGKSTNSLLVARNAQNIHIYAQALLDHPDDRVKEKAEQVLELFPDGMTVVWYDIEGSFDPVFAKKLGVDIDKLEIFEDKRIEVVGETLQAALGGAHLHIIDSTSGGSSVDELNESILKWQIGLKARAWNKVLDRFEASMDKAENAIVFIDQVRIDRRTGGFMVPGGRKMRHASSLTIQLKKGKWLFRTENGWKEEMPQKDNTVTGKAEAEGIELLSVVEKSRVGQQGRRAISRFDKKNSVFDINWEYGKIAQWFGLAKKSGSWFELPDGSKVQGDNGLKKAVEENIEFKQELNFVIEKYIVENP
jgi:recombination protein RecA